MYLIPWAVLIPQRMSRQAPASLQHPERDQESLIQPVPLVPKCPQPLRLGRSSSCSPELLPRGTQQPYDRVGRVGRKTPTPVRVRSTSQEPSTQPACTGTFAQHPISVTLIIFLNMPEEEASWKRSVWNLLVKRKLCCFSKKSFFM